VPVDALVPADVVAPGFVLGVVWRVSDGRIPVLTDVPVVAVFDRLAELGPPVVGTPVIGTVDPSQGGGQNEAVRPGMVTLVAPTMTAEG
jgi:hypothetical protein